MLLLLESSLLVVALLDYYLMIDYVLLYDHEGMVML